MRRTVAGSHHYSRIVADYTRLALCKPQVVQVASERQNRNILA